MILEETHKIMIGSSVVVSSLFFLSGQESVRGRFTALPSVWVSSPFNLFNWNGVAVGLLGMTAGSFVGDGRRGAVDGLGTAPSLSSCSFSCYHCRTTPIRWFRQRGVVAGDPFPKVKPQGLALSRAILIGPRLGLVWYSLSHDVQHKSPHLMTALVFFGEPYLTPPS